MNTGNLRRAIRGRKPCAEFFSSVRPTLCIR